MAKSNRYYVDITDSKNVKHRLYFFTLFTKLTSLEKMVGEEYKSIKDFLVYLEQNPDVKLLSAHSIALPHFAKHLLTVCNYHIEKRLVSSRGRLLYRKIPVPTLTNFFEIVLQPLYCKGLPLEGGMVQFAESYLTKYTGIVYNTNVIALNTFVNLYFNYNFTILPRSVIDNMTKDELEKHNLKFADSLQTRDGRYVYYFDRKVGV